MRIGEFKPETDIVHIYNPKRVFGEASQDFMDRVVERTLDEVSLEPGSYRVFDTPGTAWLSTAHTRFMFQETAPREAAEERRPAADLTQADGDRYNEHVLRYTATVEHKRPTVPVKLFKVSSYTKRHQDGTGDNLVFATMRTTARETVLTERHRFLKRVRELSSQFDEVLFARLSRKWFPQIMLFATDEPRSAATLAETFQRSLQLEKTPEDGLEFCGLQMNVVRFFTNEAAREMHRQRKILALEQAAAESA